jgi:thiosulfate/3-mercaptopyruvate sulfurtransferase
MAMTLETARRGLLGSRVSVACVLFLIAAAPLLTASCAGNAGDSASSGEPWGNQTVEPANLVRELAGADKPVVVCTAPPFMYRTGHIPGAVLHGPTSAPAALNDLTAWAQTLPRSTNLVVYCGCCPLGDCPNLRPAYAALKSLGFTRVRVLILPNNFGTDWVRRGYPIDRQSP